MNYLEQINEAARSIQGKTDAKPTIGLVLGSGLGSLADQLQDATQIPYAEIPHFPVSTVQGHDGTLVIGELEGKTVVAMKGRIHYYEGYSMQQITFPVRVMKALGIQQLIVTSACGGINSDFYPGALVLVKDHINLMGDNPLMGENYEELGPRFPDMSEAYSKRLRALSQKVASDNDIEVFEGLHCSISGPYYLSTSELRMVKLLGAESIGMSMIPEIITAAHAGLEALGIACITDQADPDGDIEPLNHATVVEMANRTRPKFIKLVCGIVEKL